MEYKLISNGYKFLLKCPFHKESNPSLTIRSDTGLYGCFSCNTNGPNIAHFLKRLLGKDVDIREFVSEKDELQMQLNKIYSKSADKLLQFDTYSEFLEVYKYESQNFVPAMNNPCSSNYLINERKLHKSIIENFNLKYATCGQYEKRIIIPYMNGKKTIGFNSRLIGTDKSQGKELRYRYFLSPKEFEGYLYNLDHVSNRKYCILVEGPFDLMYLVQCGFKNVISTLNTRVSNEHLLKISEFEKIIFCFDNDEKETGKNSMLKAAKHILNILPEKEIYYIDLPFGKDPNECSPGELKLAFSKMNRLILDKKEDRHFQAV